MKTFQPFVVKNLELKNRVVFPPMDLYCAKTDGNVTDEHFVHYVSRAAGGTGLIIMEATAVLPNGRISDNCLGIWEDAQVTGLSRVAQGCRRYGAKVALQLNHAGRKCTAGAQDPEYTVAPSPIAFDETYRKPREISTQEMREVVEAFREGARRADAAGFDAIEIHGAHGYLISEFLSPLTNKRTDEYGGNTENRTRFLREVLEAVHSVWPEEKAVLLRVSATDHLPDGMQVDEMVEMVRIVRDLVDVVHVSSGGVVLARIDTFPGYQAALSETIRTRCQVPTIAVGLIKTLDVAEEILGNGRADLVALGRELFRNPFWVLQNAFARGMDMDTMEVPTIYREAFLDKLR